MAVCFRDMTFCEANCENVACHRNITPAVKAAGEKWWGSPDFPIAVSDFSKTCGEYKARADKAEKLLADVRYFSRRWSGCKAVADYIDEQAALPESAPKAQDMKEKPHGT